jgi:hypothetical protein
LFSLCLLCRRGDKCYLALQFILLRNSLDLILRFWIIKRELEKIADEATTDCYNEYEQIVGWCAYLEDEINLPCKCKIGQNDGLLIGFDTNKDGSSLLAAVKVDMNEYKIAAETVSILDKKTSKYLEAFKEWL